MCCNQGGACDTAQHGMPSLSHPMCKLMISQSGHMWCTCFDHGHDDWIAAGQSCPTLHKECCQPAAAAVPTLQCHHPTPQHCQPAQSGMRTVLCLHPTCHHPQRGCLRALSMATAVTHQICCSLTSGGMVSSSSSWWSQSGMVPLLLLLLPLLLVPRVTCTGSSCSWSRCSAWLGPWSAGASAQPRPVGRHWQQQSLPRQHGQAHIVCR